MCIVSDRILDVHSTKIFAMPSKSGKRQLTVYSNCVSTPESNVMCLPVPNPRSVRFESVPADIFKQCTKSFGKKTKCMDFTIFYSSYKVKVVNSMNELNNQNGFILSQDVIDYLKKYPKHFGVILCKLKKGNKQYKPLAYSHTIQDKLFFPTKQYIIKDNLDKSIDWDIEIFSIAAPSGHDSSLKLIQPENKIIWNKLPDNYKLDKFATLRCCEKYGYNPNIDIEMTYNLRMLF